jgi:hypothetical protein
MAATLNLTSDILIALVTLIAGAIGFYFITKFQLKLINKDNQETKEMLKSINGALIELKIAQATLETEIKYLKEEIRSYKQNERAQYT